MEEGRKREPTGEPRSARARARLVLFGRGRGVAITCARRGRHTSANSERGSWAGTCSSRRKWCQAYSRHAAGRVDECMRCVTV